MPVASSTAEPASISLESRVLRLYTEEAEIKRLGRLNLFGITGAATWNNEAD